MKKEVKEIDGKRVSIYINDEVNVPIIFSSDVSDSGASIIKECGAIQCPAFHFVSISKIRWDIYEGLWTDG